MTSSCGLNLRYFQSHLLSDHAFIINDPHLYRVSLSYRVTVLAATLIFISGRSSTILSAQEGSSGNIYNLVKI